jgi:primosomal protein N' (replication factor Y)
MIGKKRRNNNGLGWGLKVIVKVIVDLPVAQPLDYLSCEDPEESARLVPGAICVVPVGRRRHIGLVTAIASASSIEPARLRRVSSVVAGVVLDAGWLELCRFAAGYYHRGWGEIAIPALPPRLRRLPGKRGPRALARTPSDAAPAQADVGPPSGAPADLRDEQRAAVEAIVPARGFAPFLLFGITGSGKTEVYLGAVERVLARDPAAQALLLVPEINLTPQLEARLAARFPLDGIASLHSGLGDRERDLAWFAAHEGRARIVLGTRLSVFASIPRLAIVVVDEEHDASFKSHSGAPYSARDLAVKRAQLCGIPVVLGSATPSIETWQHARAGRYRLLELSGRGAQDAGAGHEPRISTVDLRADPPDRGITRALRDSIDASLAAGEQALVFLNRRGFAPVLSCAACGWHTRCPACDTFAAYHKAGARVRCHHCGWSSPVPAACPQCGNQDLEPVGQGTQRIEEALRHFWPQARVARVDRDTTTGGADAREPDAAPVPRGQARQGVRRALEAVHAGDVDILVGTQMIAKGHDFRRVTTVGILNADGQLVAPDFRAPERLFALLLQVSGRAGRGGQESRVLVQTRYPGHPLFDALARRDFAAFADGLLGERESAGMPPFSYQALLTASAHDLDTALAFLRRCRALGEPLAQDVLLFDPVPMPMVRLASRSRAQLLVEAARRGALHAFLAAWMPLLRAARARGVERWDLDVDPQAI